MRPLFLPCLVLTIFLLTSLSAPAADKVAVIPLWTTKDLKNVVTVSRKNGDFTDPIEALQSITDAGPDNPYLVVIGPGEYALSAQLVLKEYVVLAGSGETATRLTGATGSTNVDATSALVIGADNASLRWLTLVNSGNGAAYVTGLYFDGASPDISNITVQVTGASQNYGIVGLNSTAAIHDTTILVANGTMGVGLAAGTDANLTLTNLNILSRDASVENCGILIIGSDPSISNSRVVASGGETSYGIYGYTAAPTLANISCTATGGSLYNYGGYFYGSTSSVRRSTLEGETSGPATSYGLYTVADTTQVSQSTIIGGVGGTGTPTCVASDNGAGGVLLQNGCN